MEPTLFQRLSFFECFDYHTKHSFGRSFTTRSSFALQSYREKKLPDYFHNTNNAARGSAVSAVPSDSKPETLLKLKTFNITGQKLTCKD